MDFNFRKITVPSNMEDVRTITNTLFEKISSLEMKLRANDKSVVIVLDSCKELGNNTINRLSGMVKKTNTQFYQFGNNEVNTFPIESIRQNNVYIIASGSNMEGASINDNIITMLSLIRSCRDASAKYITLVCPYFPYSRSDKKDKSRMPIMAKLMCDLIKISGADRIITIDLHSAQIQGFFEGPFDNLYAINHLINAIKTDFDMKDCIIVSPDAGGEKRAAAWSSKLDIPYTFLTKSRDHNKVSVIAKHELVHQLDFSNKVAILIDDIGDTLGTLCSAANILKNKGTNKIIAVVTHGIFSGKAFDNLNKSVIDYIYVTNTLPQDENIKKSDKIKVVNISNLFARAIECCVNAKSISSLF